MMKGNQWQPKELFILKYYNLNEADNLVNGLHTAVTITN